jgi:Ca2+-transporting ATPase
MLGLAAFGMYWWQSDALGEPQARGLALVVLLAGYQMLLFAERLTLPEAVARIPRTPVFWIVSLLAAVSLVVILYVPFAAELFRVTPPPGTTLPAALALGAAAVGWRFMPWASEPASIR